MIGRKALHRPGAGRFSRNEGNEWRKRRSLRDGLVGSLFVDGPVLTALTYGLLLMERYPVLTACFAMPGRLL